MALRLHHTRLGNRHQKLHMMQVYKCDFIQWERLRENITKGCRGPFEGCQTKDAPTSSRNTVSKEIASGWGYGVWEGGGGGGGGGVKLSQL